MKNADMPAMPVLEPNDISEGLTKREMFAMHAAQVPEWFCDKWFSDNENQYVPEYCERGSVSN